MSSELLVSGSGLCKSYTGISDPFAAFCHALAPSWFKPAKTRRVLEEVDLVVRRGETVGIIGKNGAGKTTLLGVLGGVIVPNSGTVSKHCKIATLLGLSAGFSPNFTGRENAYLFCSIQGIPRKNAESVVRSAEEFAELGEYFDLPIRSYSSGMQARLGFSCAVNVFADLIIIDETLAVGDASFKLKCYDKIKSMQADGQSFLLVSHSQNIIANYCTRAVVLDAGKKVFDGDVLEALLLYKNIRTAEDARKGVLVDHAAGGGKLAEQDVSIGDLIFSLEARESGCTKAIISARLSVKRTILHPTLDWGIRTAQGIIVAHSSDGIDSGLGSLHEGTDWALFFTFDHILQPGKYFFSATLREVVDDVSPVVATFQNALSFDVQGTPAGGVVDLGMKLGVEIR
jgi:ABC-type polysaccharide/polyol phosphate transport system ATPase subunit